MDTLEYTAIRHGIIHTCREMNATGLNKDTSGNVSHRIENGMLITPSGLPYAEMKPEDIVEMSFDAAYEGIHRPYSEWRFHRDILKTRSDANVVLHTHSPYSTTLAIHEKNIPPFYYVAVTEGVDIRCAPYACFGTQALSDYALKALEGRNACLLAHHGLIILAESFARALRLVTEVEVLAMMYVHELAIGEPPLLSIAENDASDPADAAWKST